MSRVTYKSALITGGSSGIGLALAKQLAASGANVTIIARRAELLESALQSIEQYRQTEVQSFEYVQLDVAGFVSVERTLVDIMVQNGAPDLLINSAGIAHPGRFEELPVEVFRSTMDINYFGTVNTCRVIVPKMIRCGSVHIVNISSVVGLLGLYGYTAYGASKYAVRGFSDVLRSEMKLHGIDVSIVFPPDTQTPQLEYENQYKPEITKVIAGNAGVMSSDQVAKEILDGLGRQRYMIIPGTEGKLIFALTCWLGELVYPLMDWMISRAKRQVDKLDKSN